MSGPDPRVEKLLEDLTSWWTSANSELHSPRFHGPDSEKNLRDACNLVAMATKKLAKSSVDSMARM